jgi:hypothetical protein
MNKMNNKIILGIIFILCIFITGCSTSDYQDCYSICRNIEYQKIEYGCNYYSTYSIEKYCNITNETNLRIKENCSNKCLEKELEK